MAENKTGKNDTNDVEVEQTSIDYFHQHSQTPIETSSEDHFDSNQKYRPNYLNIFLTVFVICGFAVVLTIACINLIQIHQSTNTIMVDQLFNYVLIDNDAVKKDTSLIFQTSVNLTIADSYTSLIGVKSKLCQSLLENLMSTCPNGIETCETEAFYNFLSKLSSSTLNSTFQTYKFDWAKNVTAAKLIEISSEYYLDIDVEDVKVMYWMVFGFNYNTTAPTIDDTSSSSGKSANLISVLEKSIESIYSSCGWFYLDVIHLETIRLTKRPNSFIR